MPWCVAEDLHLDVARALDVALDEHGAVAERRGRLPLGAGTASSRSPGSVDEPHAAPAAAGRALTSTG